MHRNAIEIEAGYLYPISIFSLSFEIDKPYAIGFFYPLKYRTNKPIDFSDKNFKLLTENTTFKY